MHNQRSERNLNMNFQETWDDISQNLWGPEPSLLDHLKSQMVLDQFNVSDVEDGVTPKDIVHPT